MPDVITCTSEGDDPSGRRRPGVNRPDDAPARPAQGCELGAMARENPPAGRDREPVCEPHDSTGEPGAGNRHAGFGERGEETYPRDSACGPVAKAPDKPPTPTGYAPLLDSTKSLVLGIDMIGPVSYTVGHVDGDKPRSNAASDDVGAHGGSAEERCGTRFASG